MRRYDLRFPRRRMDFANSGRHGAAMIGLLVVLVIIMVLMLKGPLRQDPVTGVTQAQTHIDKAGDAACAMNLQSLRTELQRIRIGSGGSLPSINILRRTSPGTTYKCPRDGKVQIDDQGNVYCVKHEPPPENVTVEDLQT